MPSGRFSRLRRQVTSNHYRTGNKPSFSRRLRHEWLENRALLAPFTPGDFVAYRISQPGPVNVAASAVFIDEFDPAGNLVQSIPMPTTVAGNQRRLTAGGLSPSGPSTMEGFLTLSTDGQYLVLTGFDAAVGTTPLASTTSSAINRVVGRIDAQGNVDTSTIISDGYSTSSIRGAASVDGTRVWTSGGSGGGTGGVRSALFGNTVATTQISNTITDIRAAGIFGGQLYVSANTGGILIGKVDSGLPTTSGQPITNLPGITSAFLTQPNQFVMADLNASVPGPDTLYVADDTVNTGLRKFSLVGGTWVYNGSLTPDGKGFRGLAASVNSGVVTLYASGADTANNQIWKITDSNGWNAPPPLPPIDFFIGGLPGNGYRGLALVPIAAPTGTLSATLDGGGNLTVTDIDAAGKNNNLTVSAAGSNLVITDVNEQFVAAPTDGTLSNGNKTLTIPLTSVTGSLTVSTAGGADVLTVDLSGGDAIPPGNIAFAGGGPTTGPGDKLIITGGSQGTVTYNYASAHDGSVGMSNFGTINYTGLEPIANSGTAADVIFNLPAITNTVTLGDDGVTGNGLSRLSGATLETTDFSNPSGSLTINRGSAADAIAVNSLPDFTASLIIGSATNPLNTIGFAGSITLGSGKSLSGAAATITSTVAAAVTVSGGGAINLRADGAMIDGSSILNAGSGLFSLVPVTAGQSINLGGADTSGTLGLTDAEIDRITAGAVQIGNASSGPIAVSTPITHPAASNFSLTSGGNINFNPGSINTGGGTLTLNPGPGGSIQPITSGIDATTSASAVSFGSGADLAIAVNGSAVDTGYTQLNIAGQVNLTSVDLVLSGSYIPATSDSFIIVANDGTDAVIGTFNGLPEGATLNVNGVSRKITYVGGTGNDVALIPVPIVAPVVEGTGGDDTFVLKRDAAVASDFRLSLNGGPDVVFHNPPSITVNGVGGNDTLIFSDLANVSSDNSTITESQIDIFTGSAPTPQIRFQNIDVLNVTGTGASDIFDVLLNSGSDLDIVTVNGNDGNDQFYLDLNATNHTTNDVGGLASVNLNGDAGNDTFGNTPTNAPLPVPPSALPPPAYPIGTFPGVPRGAIELSTTTSIVINGGAPTTSGAAPFNATAGNAAGDTLSLDLTPSYANPNATAIVSTVGGSAQTTSYKTVNFGDIEAVNLIDNGLLTRTQMGDLYIRGTESGDLIQLGVTLNPNVANTRINNTIQTLAVTTKTIVYGRGGNDTITQGTLAKPAEFYGEAGDDYLAGYKFNDLLVGGDGNDRILGGEGDNELWGDRLGDQNLNRGGNDIMSAGGGNDRFYGGGGGDSITAGGGADVAYGGFGDDSIDGGDGDDRLYGGDGNDTLTGANGNDLLAGNGGDDKLYGKAGNDVLIGGQGADIIAGDDGNDLMFDGEVVVLNPAGTDASTAFGDMHDVAMAALLLDWVSDNELSLPVISLHDSSIDSLGGGSGTDTASAGSGDVGDWELLLM